MRVIIVGAGDVGQHLARTLSAERHDVTLVDQDAVRVDSIQGELDALVIPGNGASPKLLRDIGAEDADLLCAVTQSDEANVIAALAAHQLGAKRTIARVRDTEYFGADESFAYDVLGIDLVIHPERATAEDLSEAILLPGAVHVEHFVGGRVTVAETMVSPQSPLIGRAIGNRKLMRPHSIVALIRGGRTVPAEPGHRAKAGDHILIAAAREDIGVEVAHLGGHVRRVRDVVIFGGGRVGLPLARRLEATDNFRITVIESSAERARHLAEQLRQSTVLHEEGTSKEVMLAHGVDRTGAFVACAGDDRANLLTSLNAKQLGADLCLAVVSREEYTPLVDALGIDAAFSPRLVTAEAILRAVRGGNVAAVHLMIGGAELIELQLDPSCRADGRRVRDVEALALTHVAAIVRGERVIIPGPDDVVRGGDQIVVFNSRPGVAELERTFRALA